MTDFNLILQDLLSADELVSELPIIPYPENVTVEMKVDILYGYLLRARKIKQRISSLVYAYLIGQIITSREITKTKIREIISEHFYIVALRTYYIFETEPCKIYNTKYTSIAMIRTLKQGEFKKLIVEL